MAISIQEELADRRRRLDEALPRIVEDLKARGARLIVLFGSEARGERRKLADIDLLVVIDSKEAFVDRLAGLYRVLRPGVELDLLAYTPQEFETVRDRPFVRHILSEGKLLYEA